MSLSFCSDDESDLLTLIILYLPVLSFKSWKFTNETLFNWKSISSKNGAFGVPEFLADGSEFDAAYPLSSSKYTFVTSDVTSYFIGTGESPVLFGLFNFLLKLEFVLIRFIWSGDAPLLPLKPFICIKLSPKISLTYGCTEFAVGYMTSSGLLWFTNSTLSPTLNIDLSIDFFNLNVLPSNESISMNDDVL